MNKRRPLDLITDGRGKPSRVQITLWLSSLLAIALIVLEVIRKDVLTWPVLATLGGLHVFAWVDQIHIRHVELQLSKTGATIEIEGDAEAEETKGEKQPD